MKNKFKKTRNIVLFFAIAMVVLYTAINILFGFLNTQNGTVFQLDATQTTEWFSFWKWVVISGGGITVAKTLKGNSNSDDYENGGVI